MQPTIEQQRLEALLTHVDSDERNAARGWALPSEAHVAADLGLQVDTLRCLAARLVEARVLDATYPPYRRRRSA